MKKSYSINGMHCVSCELLLEKELKKIPGLKSCTVSHKRNTAEIVCDNSVTDDAVNSAIQACGYSLKDTKKHAHNLAQSSKHLKSGKKDNPNKEQKNSLIDYVQLAYMAIAMFALFYLLNKLEITRYFPNFGDKVNIFIAFLIGFVASISTCLALVGGIVISFGSMVKVNEQGHSTLFARTLPHLYFHAGRIGGFMLLGAILGLIGSKINYSLSFTGFLTIIISVVMLYIGLQILNIVPNITKLGFHLPKNLSRNIDLLQQSNHHLAPLLIGVMTFFLPCGFTQTMQLAAVVSQNPFTGALIMGAFALGTMPVLLAVGVGSTYAKKSGGTFAVKIIGILILFFSLYSLNSGLVLAGSPITLGFLTSANKVTTDSSITDGVQVVKMDVDWAFTPNEFKVVIGVPVRWEINGINVSGCSNEIVIPSYNIRQKIAQGPNVIEFTPETDGEIPFSCWMGMLNGRFIVTDDAGTAGNSN